MIKWFVEKAPIRQKLATAFGFFCALLIGGGLAVYLADHQLGEALAAQDLAAAKAVHEGMLAWAWTFSIGAVLRSEEHTSELQSLMRISYAVFCLKKTN